MTAGGEGRCSTCGHAATEHRPRFGCCEATLVGEEWEGCPCNLVSTAVDEMRCSACLHPAHRGPCHVTVRSPLVAPPNGDFPCACPPDADWPGEDDDA
jgi:hypothetical protein